MNIRRNDLLSAFAIGTGLLLVPGIATAQQPTSAQIVASPDRTAADRTTDLRRKPEQMLAFIAARAPSPSWRSPREIGLSGSVLALRQS